jgi:hypothetical protein
MGVTIPRLAFDVMAALGLFVPMHHVGSVTLMENG